MTQATAIGFFRHSPDMPTASEMMRVYHVLESIMRRVGAAPTHFSADDGVGRAQYNKVGGALHKRVLERETVGFRSIGFAAAPPNSDAPGYDGFASASFIFAPEAGIVQVALVAHEPYLQCGSTGCDDIVAELARLWRWDYGFGFERDAATAPGVYLGGGGSNLHSGEDERRTDLWYQSSHDFYKGVEPPRRLIMVRDVFPYNMVDQGHLTHRLRDGRNLREFIKDDADSELHPLTDKLWLWKVRPDRTEAVRDKLRGMGVIITE